MPTLMVTKGQTKQLPKGHVFTAGIGWDDKGPTKTDLDMWTLVHLSDGTVTPVYWGNADLHRPDLGSNSEGSPFVASPEQDVVYQGDDRSGVSSATGYDEITILDLSKAPATVVKYSLFVTIYDENGAGLTLGMAEKIVCGVKDESTGNELKLAADDHGFDVSVLLCTINRTDDGKWTMTGVDQGYTDDMFTIGRSLGVVFGG